MSLGANLVQASRLRAAYGSIFERWRDLERTSMSPHPARGWGIVGDLTLAYFHQHCPCICQGGIQRSLARASTHLQMRLGVQDAGSSPLSAWPFFQVEWLYGGNTGYPEPGNAAQVHADTFSKMKPMACRREARPVF